MQCIIRIEVDQDYEDADVMMQDRSQSKAKRNEKRSVMFFCFVFKSLC